MVADSVSGCYGLNTTKLPFGGLEVRLSGSKSLKVAIDRGPRWVA